MKKIILTTAFIIYFVIVIVVTQLPISLPFSYVGLAEINYNFTPFYFITNIINQLGAAVSSGLSIKNYIFHILRNSLQNVILNIVMFIPLGCMLKINKQQNNIMKVIHVSFGLSLLLEIMQAVGMVFSLNHSRVFDIDDILANTIGGVLGFLVIRQITKKSKTPIYQ